MSDYYEEDSFESESDPESGEREEDRGDSRDTLQDPRVWGIQQVSGLISSGTNINGGSNSEAEEQELSRIRRT